MNLGIVQIASESPLNTNGVQIASESPLNTNGVQIESGARAHSMEVEHKAGQRPVLVFDLQRLYVKDILIGIVDATIDFADELQ